MNHGIGHMVTGGGVWGSNTYTPGQHLPPPDNTRPTVQHLPLDNIRPQTTPTPWTTPAPSWTTPVPPPPQEEENKPIRSMGGRYASYWNASLLLFVFARKIGKIISWIITEGPRPLYGNFKFNW